MGRVLQTATSPVQHLQAHTGTNSLTLSINTACRLALTPSTRDSHPGSAGILLRHLGRALPWPVRRAAVTQKSKGETIDRIAMPAEHKTLMFGLITNGTSHPTT